MQKEGQSSRQFVKSHLMTIMGVDIVKATQLVDEMEQVGLIRFDEFGNVGILVLEGQLRFSTFSTNRCGNWSAFSWENC
ncbi:TPA: hypothetical protein VZY92_000085 [Streptococcus pneumoniae]|nr:hypothetical protein [Streptococcus pneumoniae]